VPPSSRPEIVHEISDQQRADTLPEGLHGLDLRGFIGGGNGATVGAQAGRYGWTDATHDGWRRGGDGTDP
jgi:hypothetical protein